MANSVTHSKNTPIFGSKHTVFMEFRKSDGTTLAPTSLDSEVSKDGGTFADCWEEVTLIKEVDGATDSAYGYLTLIAAEMSADTVTVQIKSANCVTIGLQLFPERVIEVVDSTAQAGDAGEITLNATESAVENIYRGMYVQIWANTGSGQVRHITYYDGASKIATVAPNWEVNPASGSKYYIGTLESQSVNATHLDADVSSAGGSGLTAQQVRDAMKLAPTAGAPSAGSVDEHLDDILTDTGTTLPATVSPAAVWGYGTRTLTQVQTSAIDDADVQNLELIIATTFEVTWSGLSIDATWTAIEFTAKRVLSGADTTALLQVLISNPGAGGDGLQRYMGLAGTAYADHAALTVNQSAGSVTLLVEDDVTALLTAQKVYYDLKQMLADGSSSILVDGVLNAVYTPTMTINL